MGESHSTVAEPRLSAGLSENPMRLRRAARMSQDELAAAAGTSRPTISRIERGKGNRHAALLQSIAKALNTDAGTLLDSDPLAVELGAVFGRLDQDGKQAAISVISDFANAMGRARKPA